MVCPSCGAQVDGHGKFCAVCGAHLPEAAAPPPAWSQPAALPPAQPPAWSQPAAPQYGAPPAPYAPPQYSAPPPPPYGAPGYGAPQYGAPYGGAAYGAAYPTARPGGSAPLAGLLALAGGAVAVASAWLPWATFMDTSTKLIDATDTSRLECGYYLVAGGAIAAVCGLLLLLRTGNLHMLLALGAIAGGALAVVVEVAAYNQVNQVNDLANLTGGSIGITYGIGLFVGIGGGVAGALGGLAGLVSRR
jgi:hypothetical protein